MQELCFSIGNEYIERKVFFQNGVPVRGDIMNKKTGAIWASDGKEPLIAFSGIDFCGAHVRLFEKSVEILGKDFKLVWEFNVFDNIPVIESRIGLKGRKRSIIENKPVGGDGIEGVFDEPSYKDYADGLGCCSNHVSLTVTKFFDRTDYTNYLVDRKMVPLYNMYGIGRYSGHIFTLREEITGEECLIVKNAPCAYAHYNKRCEDFISAPISNIHIASSGIDTSELDENKFTYSYPIAVGVSEKHGSDELFSKYYTSEYKRKKTYIMSNTWGDRNNDKCVCEEFILSEIDRAQQLRADIVQIDDGWQEGITANSALSSGGCWCGGYRNSNPDFWEINRKKFPNGFKKIVDTAKEKNILIGLWFSPDNYGDYEEWEKDADTILGFYKNFGIRYFKLDGIKIDNRTCEENIYKMLQKVNKESDKKIVFNMDITNGKRFGYLFHKEIGDLFVENRYTDTTNYYPHNTLRNLWDLSHYIPAERLQMEVLNNKRNIDKYNDILAPGEYDIDYIFASVMAANPLLWMELSALDEESVRRLRGIISVYKEYRDDFKRVIPILDRPSGFSLTGFKIEGKKHNYVILLRELSEECNFDIDVKKILITNDDSASCSPARLNRKRSYLFGIC